MKKATLLGVTLLVFSFVLCACDSNSAITSESPTNDLPAITDFQQDRVTSTDTLEDSPSQGDKSKSELDIKNDVSQSDVWKALNVEITDFTIIKRQTTPEQKIDTVYVTVTGENDDYMCVRNYVIEYELYNEGWLVEEIKPYEAAQNQDATIPLHGVQESLPKNENEMYDNPTYPNALISTLQSGVSVVSSDIENGIELYEFSRQYEYEYIIETKTITLTYLFINFQWTLFDFSESIKVNFKENIIGTWQAIFTASGYNGAYEYDYLFAIHEIDGNRCYITYEATQTRVVNSQRSSTRSGPSWREITLEIDEDGSSAYIMRLNSNTFVFRIANDGLLYYKPSSLTLSSYTHVYTIAIHGISRGYQRQKTNLRSLMDGSGRKPQQYLAEAGVIT